MSLNVPAGQTVTLTLAIDISGGLSAGNTVAFSLNSASDVSAWDASNNALTPSGFFPMNGNQFTVTTGHEPQSCDGVDHHRFDWQYGNRRHTRQPYLCLNVECWE